MATDPPGDLQVDVWLATPDDALAGAGRAILSPGERERAGRFLNEGALRDYLVGRWLTRTRLSAYAERSPADWRFVANAYGCPALGPDDATGLRFNLSHTFGLVALVVCKGHAVGIDVEDTCRKSRTVAIADRFFSPSEVAALRRLPSHAQRDRFFDYWTLKESYIKARGMGLAIPLKHFSFQLDAGPTIGVSLHAALGDDASRWHFELGRPTERHRLAVAVASGRLQPKIRLHWVSAPPA